MANFEITSPDGKKYRVTAPDGATQEQVLSYAQSQFKPQEKPDPTEGMTGAQKFLAGTGKGMVDIGRGAGQLLGMVKPEDVEKSRALDAPLMKTGAGAIGNIVGAAVPAIATMMIPGVNTYTGASLAGATLGALSPRGEGETLVANMALGAAGGVAGQGVSNLIGRVISPVKSTLTDEQKRLAVAALKQGIPLDAAQATGSKPLQTLSSVFSNLPLTASKEAARKSAQQTAFNTAVMKTAGENTDNAAPEVVDRMFKRLGGNFEDIYKRNVVKVDDNLLDSLGKVEKQYGMVLDPNQKAIISRNIDAILGDGSNMTGETYQATRSLMGRLQKSQDPNLSQAAKGIKTALDEAAERSLDKADLSLLKETQRQYGSAKTISNAMKTAAGTSGDIPGASLRTAMKASGDNFTRGKGDLNDLARIGETFMKDAGGNPSGTAKHAYMQNIMTGGIGGLGGYAGSGGNMETAALAAGGGLLAPRVIQALMNNPAMQNYLVSNQLRQLLSSGAQQTASPLLTGAGAAGLLGYAGQ